MIILAIIVGLFTVIIAVNSLADFIGISHLRRISMEVFKKNEAAYRYLAREKSGLPPASKPGSSDCSCGRSSSDLTGAGSADR